MNACRRMRSGECIKNMGVVMPQEQQHGSRQVRDEELSHNTAQHVQGDDQQVNELDMVLDDIETTLAENAEEYVSRFVQKGGE